MFAPRLMICAGFLGLVACDQPQGVGLGPLGQPGPATLPQSTRTTFELGSPEPLPVYSFTVGETENNPANSVNIGGPGLRVESANLLVEIDDVLYGMRHVEVNHSDYVVVEGGPPVSELPREIKTRSGCLVVSEPLRSSDAVVYTLDCN